MLVFAEKRMDDKVAARQLARHMAQNIKERLGLGAAADHEFPLSVGQVETPELESGRLAMALRAAATVSCFSEHMVLAIERAPLAQFAITDVSQVP